MLGSEETSRPESPVTRLGRGRPDKKTPVESWHTRASASPHQNQHGFDLIARLYLFCLKCLDDLICQVPPSGDPETARTRVVTEQCQGNANLVASHKVLKRVRYVLKVWGDSYEVGEGKLDEKLQASSELKYEVWDLLRSIGGTLARPVARLICTPSEETSVTLLQDFLDETSFVTGPCVELFDYDSDQENDNEDRTEANSTDATEEMLETLLTDVECLQELGPALECPFQDPDYDEDPRSIDDAAAGAVSLLFVESIEHKYPHASPTIIKSLAERTMTTFSRLQAQRRANEEKETSEVLLLDTATVAASSTFHDSGIASSVAPTSAPYAPTRAASIVTSLSENGHLSYPSLSNSAKQGEAFFCLACGRMLSVRSVRNWRDHLISDLQPYICVFPGCSFTPPPMEKKLLSGWFSHLQVAHPLAKGCENMQCPLCLQFVTHLKYVTHVGQHLEEIALVALPRECEPDTNSVNEYTLSPTTWSAATTSQAESGRNTGESTGQLDSSLRAETALSTSGHIQGEISISEPRDDPKPTDKNTPLASHQPLEDDLNLPLQDAAYSSTLEADFHRSDLPKPRGAYHSGLNPSSNTVMYSPPTLDRTQSPSPNFSQREIGEFKSDHNSAHEDVLQWASTAAKSNESSWENEKSSFDNGQRETDWAFPVAPLAGGTYDLTVPQPFTGRLPAAPPAEGVKFPESAESSSLAPITQQLIGPPFRCEWRDCNAEFGRSYELWESHVSSRHLPAAPPTEGVDSLENAESSGLVAKTQQPNGRPFCPFRCEWRDCNAQLVRNNELRHHVRNRHLLQSQFWCPVPGCKRSEAPEGKPFLRRDKYNQHFKDVHGRFN
ncbi:MAG: hypothetical protein M1821_005110 [Bathelium mastoideum]|nr:MAG: hypothetical protein M1821_005110 [Bathelium mastoideum]